MHQPDFQTGQPAPGTFAGVLADTTLSDHGARPQFDDTDGRTATHAHSSGLAPVVAALEVEQDT